MEDDDGSRGEPNAIFGLEEDSKGRKRSSPFSSPPFFSIHDEKKVPMDEKEAVGELGGQIYQELLWLKGFPCELSLLPFSILPQTKELRRKKRSPSFLRRRRKGGEMTRKEERSGL